MAHFAQLDENNIVINVIVIHNNELLDENGNESEEKGIRFCKDHYGEETRWVQTSYNNTFRKWYAGIGWSYNQELDAFIEPQPFPSWSLNEELCIWEAPIPIPEDHMDGKIYHWDEDIKEWVFDGTIFF
jgi:hypothetical protein